MTAQAFLKEFQKIILSQPKVSSYILNSENCTGDSLYYSKNLNECFDCANSTDSIYLYDSFMCANSVDCDYAVESQLCYESVDIYKCFNCDYLENSANTRDSSFCYNCDNCHDIFGCVDLDNKSFCIFNRQLTEGEYKEQIKKYKALAPERIVKIVEELEKQFPVTQTNASHNENSDFGNYIYYNKNCYLCFDAARNENCSYLYDSFYNKFSFDMTYCSQENELVYEAVDCGHLFNCAYMIYSSHCQDSSFLFNCFEVKNSLGVVGLSHKQYIILNREYSKEEYEKLSKEIFEDLRKENLGWEETKI